MSFGDLDLGQQFLQQRREFEFTEELTQDIKIGLAGTHGFDVQLDGNIGVDGGHALDEKNSVAIVLKRFAVGFLFYLVGAVEGLLDGAEPSDDFDGPFLADARGSRDVVDRVTAEGHDVDDAFRRDSKNFLHLGGVADQVVLGRIQDLNVFIDELHHVFVAGDNVDGVLRGRGFPGEGADDVVSLKAGKFEDGDTVGFEGAADVGNLLGEILGHGRTVRFVAFVLDLSEGLGFDVELTDGGDGFGLRVAERLGRDIEDSGEVGGGEIVAQLAQHVDEDVDGGGGKPGFCGHGALPRHGMIGAEDERHSVDEEDAVWIGGWRWLSAAGFTRRGFCSGGQGSSLTAGVGRCAEG